MARRELKLTTRIDLEGTFEFDAIDNTGTRLYVIEYTNVTQGYYRVRVYEVAAGKLGDYTIIDKGGSGTPDPMSGVRLSGVFSPDGNWLYSVYARQGSGAFVHALNLTQPFAFCLDLPDDGSPTDAFHWSLALTADGKHLYAANGAMGSVMQIDNLDGYDASIVRTKQIGLAGATAGALVQNVEAKELRGQWRRDVLSSRWCNAHHDRLDWLDLDRHGDTSHPQSRVENVDRMEPGRKP